MSELIAENLHLWRGEQHVLRGICFELARGQCLQIMGANGSGKTTLLRALCGLVPLEEGQVRWRGELVSGSPHGFHTQLGYLGHDNGLKPDLTALENLRFATQLRRRAAGAQIAAALERTGVADCAAQLLRRLSAGQRRRVALARILLTQVPLWVLDEPAANLDPRGQSLVTELLATHVTHGGMAIVATHQPLGLTAPQLVPMALQ
ncbi:MAG TPA: cytochrome c biogenesis heme-transporting ATPase CcmA [Steroidobacteraceae bacterium]|jgi:heme exporter protein A|nr:cytochrome c biogenesis heme-transporting ATPase CcmA [Steroidobacteraceae bacterium]